MTMSFDGMRRFARIARIVARHLAMHLLLCWVARYPRVMRRTRAEFLPGPIRLRVALEELGGSFIKLGQMLALQPDILSLEYCNALFSLLDRVAPFDYTDVERTCRDELGAPPEELFDTFDPHPLATASVGQVHVATLGGRRLAVKIRRPNVECDFAGDLRLITGMTVVIRWLHLSGFYWLLEPLEEFAAWTREELDYRVEARYMTRLRQNAEGRLTERVPAVLRRYTTRRTLVAEFLEGQTVLSCLRAREDADPAAPRQAAAADIDSEVVCRNIIDNFVNDVFRHGMFHADLHPANLLILPGNSIGYIDFGITGVISAYSRRTLVSLTLAYTSGDLDGMAEAFFRVCRMAEHSDTRAFRGGLQNLASSWYEQDGSRWHLRKNFTLVMLDMLRLSRHCGIWPERDVVKYIRSAIAIDGLITRLTPGFDVSHYLSTVCADHLRWEMRTRLFKYETFADATAAGARIARNGIVRGSTAIGRLMDSGRAAHVESHSTRGWRQAWRAAVLSLGGLAIAILAGDPSMTHALDPTASTARLVILVAAAMTIARWLDRVPEASGQ